MIELKKLALSLAIVASSLAAYSQSVSAIYISLKNTKAPIQGIDIDAAGAILSIDDRGSLHLRGRLNNVQLEYFDAFGGPGNTGKFKSINGLNVQYFDAFETNRNIQGFVKTVGNMLFQYYSAFDGTLEGKLKMAGPYKITYYTAFDGRDREGKIKSIGDAVFTYFDTFNGGTQNAGKLRSISGNAPYLVIDDLEVCKYYKSSIKMALLVKSDRL